MALNNITVPQLQLFSEQVNEACPVLDDARSTQKDLKGRNGGKLKVAIPDPGTTVVSNGSIATLASLNTNNNEFERELEIAVASNAVQASQLELVTDVDSFDNEISGPRAVSVGRGIEKDVIGKSWIVADSARVYTSVGYGVLSDMAGDLGDSECGNDLVGYMGFGINSKIAQSGLNQFLPSTLSGDLYKDAKIGVYAGIDWKKTAMPIVTTTAAAAPSAITAADGDAGTLTVTVVNGAVYPKGYAFTLAGVYKKDLLGNDTGILKTWILQEAVTASSTSATFKVGEFSTTGAHANISATPTGKTATALLAASKSYAVVWAFQRGNLEFSPVKLPAAGLEEVSAPSKNGKVIMSAVVHADGDRNSAYRFDSAYIAGAVDSRRAAVAYIQL